MDNPHTPGPWIVEGRFCVTAEGVYIADVLYRGPEKSVAPGKQVEANVRLIAAAPDMFDALAKVADYLRRDSCLDARAVKDAIYAAMGKAQSVVALEAR